MANDSKRNRIATSFLLEAGPGRTIRVYRDKEVVYSQGSQANALFFLQSGMVKLTTVSKDRRKKAVLAILQEGDLFGEGCLGPQTRQMSSVTSIGTSTITRLEKSAFRRQIDRDPAFAAMFITYLISQTARFKEDLADHFLNFSERRLARVLLMHEKLGQQRSKGGSYTLRFSQTTLAEMVGTTRARVNSFLNEFKKKGYVRYNGGLEINAEGLTAFLQG